MPKNHLIHETSPYLLQHADNPVEWYPWGEKALNKAKKEDKPILLSIGYSACHWCHVMAHESFENENTAALMNDLFINIKVDREERPDIDKIYQTAQFLLTQRTGGWPLTMFLTPKDRIPFFGGTYFPDQARHGLPAFQDLLKYIASIFKEKSKDIEHQNQSLQNILNNIYNTQPSSASEVEEDILASAKNQLLKTFDMQYGGFGKAPKFPHPANLELLLHDWHRTKCQGRHDENVYQPLMLTLHKMASGGLFDHISGGFYRYSVDDYWMIPHFEKMLYDNGPLLALYSQSYQATQDEIYYRAANETAKWVIRDMQSPEGGYYSSLDADSEGVEGNYYTWEREHLETLLSSEEFELVKIRFAIERGPNFEDKYHLHEFVSLQEIAQQLNIDINQCNQRWQQCKQKLYAHRATRIHPARDDKILTSWNALMIKAMLIAYRVFENDDYFQSAANAVKFIQTNMFSQGRLYASYKDGQAHLNAYLDDYAFLLDALLEYLQTHWHSDYLLFAIEIADVLIKQFEDQNVGGFYFTSNDHEDLIQRPKVTSDEATPSGNGIAAYSLLRLGYLLSNPRYIEAAEDTLKYASKHINNTPMAHASLLRCHQDFIRPPETIIIRGKQSSINSWQHVCQKQFHSSRIIFAIPDDAENLPDVLNSKCSKQGETLAYFCQGTQCQAPIKNLQQLIKLFS